MTKRYREAVNVVAAADAVGAPAPVGFTWRGARYTVLAVLGHWREDAGWWSGGGVEVPQRDLWRVEARNGKRTALPGIYELVCQDGDWRLDRVWD